ncbi:hypothetical protein PspLS_07338 [Pyricularia sp. CBS 133598]|nr:hypothetical protein PspLS_07338 [Pyricularia sp. CBS 133598]
MDTDARSPSSKVDTWLNQLIHPDLSGGSSPRKVARRKHRRKDQGPYRDHIADQELSISTASKRAHVARGQRGDSILKDRRIEVEKWVSRIATRPGLTREHPSIRIAGDYASKSPDKPPHRRHSTDHQVSTGNIGHKRKKLSSEASYESTPKQRIKRSPQFEKRPRHKTREDRYDTHHSKRPRKVAEARADGNIDRDRQRSRKAALSKPSRDVVAKFTSDAILSERVTTHPGPGLFGKLNATKRPLVDLEFHDMNFLKAPCEEPSANNASRARVRNMNRQDRLNDEVSTFFTKPAPGSAGGTTVRTLDKHPSGSSGGISSPLRRQLLQRLEQVGYHDGCNTNSSLIESSSMGKITRSIIETGVLNGTGSPRRLSCTQPSNQLNNGRDTSLLQTVANADLPTVTTRKSQDWEFLATEAMPLRQQLTVQNDTSPIKQAHACPSEILPSVAAQGCIDLSASSIKSLPSSIPARPEPPKSRLVQTLQRAADNFIVPKPHENSGEQMITELQADQRLNPRIFEQSISNPQQPSIVPNATLTLLQPNPEPQFGFPPRQAADSRFHHDVRRASTSSIHTLPTNREDFYCNHASPSPLIGQDALQLTVNARQRGHLTDMAQYIAAIENDVLGAESDSKPNDTCRDEQWEQDTEAYVEPIERSQDGFITGGFTRRGRTPPLLVEEATGISMVDFWTKNPFVN